jgi:AcrR family transcriptional regulator
MRPLVAQGSIVTTDGARSNGSQAGVRTRGRPPTPGTEERVLANAVDMLSRGGYAGLTLNALAKRAGVAKTTILRRWPSKAAVAAAAVQRLALQSVDVPETGTLRGDLHALLTSAVDAFSRGAGSFVPRLMRESGHHPEIADLLRTVIHTRRGAYRRVLARAIARGELDPDVDQDLIIDLLVGPVWTRLLITHDPITETLVDDIVGAITRAYPPPEAIRNGEARPAAA